MGKKMLGLVVARPQRDYNTEIIERLSSQLSKLGYVLLVFSPFTDMAARDRNDVGERTILQLIPYRKLEGLFVMTGSFRDQDLIESIVEKGKEYGIKVMALDFDHPGIPSIVFDYEGAFESMVRHVIAEHRCKRVFMMAGMRGNEYSLAREQIFIQVCREYGINKVNSQIFYGEFWEEPARRATREFLENGQDLPDAVISANDTMALACIDELIRHGVRVPEDIIVTGMDGIIEGSYNTPRLTTVMTDMMAFCREAAYQMDNLITGNYDGERIHKISMSMTLAQSCGCCMEELRGIGGNLVNQYQRYSYMVNHNALMSSMRHKMLDSGRPAMYEVLHGYLSDESWVCINPSFWSKTDSGDEYRGDYDQDREAFEDIMEVTVSRRSLGNDMSSFGLKFRKKALLPDLQEAIEGRKYIMFLPLNYQDEVIGFFAFGDTASDMEIYRSTQRCMSISSVLHVVRDKERAEYINKMLKESNSVLHEQTIHDPLTNLLNRRGLMQGIEEICAYEEMSRDLEAGLAAEAAPGKSAEKTAGCSEGRAVGVDRSLFGKA